jgi:hypothetical protein
MGVAKAGDRFICDLIIAIQQTSGHLVALFGIEIN